MKSSIKPAIAGIFLSIALTASADWQIVEVTNNSPISYQVMAGTTNIETGMDAYNTNKLGQVESGKKFEIPSVYASYNNDSSTFPYLILHPQGTVAGMSHNIRVYFPPKQKGQTSPRGQKETVGARVARAVEYGKGRLRKTTSAEPDYAQDTIDTTQKTLILLSGQPHLRIDDQATMLTIDPERDIFITIHQDDSGKTLFPNDRQKYRVDPQSGPRGGKLKVTERLLPLANNVGDEHIQINTSYTQGEIDLSELESSESSSGSPKGKKTNLDIWNKTPKTIYFEVGTESDPPKGITLRKLAPHGKANSYIINAVTSALAASAPEVFKHATSQTNSALFKPNRMGNAYLGVKINNKGLPEFYEVEPSFLQKMRPSSKSRSSRDYSSRDHTPETTPKLPQRKPWLINAVPPSFLNVASNGASPLRHAKKPS